MFFVVVIVLVLITLAEGRSTAGSYTGDDRRRIAKELKKLQKKCSKTAKKFHGCIRKGYKSSCEIYNDGEFKEKQIKQ